MGGWRVVKVCVCDAQAIDSGYLVPGSAVIDVHVGIRLTMVCPVSGWLAAWVIMHTPWYN